METTSASLDVPYGDTFSTDTRWVMSAATGPGGKPATRVTVNVDIKFTKSVWIKGNFPPWWHYRPATRRRLFMCGACRCYPKQCRGWGQHLLPSLGRKGPASARP